MSSPSAVQQAQPLAYCAYPAAHARFQHGQQPLPDQLPLVDFGRAQPHRSTQYKTVRAATLTHNQLLQMAQGVGQSFAKRDPMSRHLQPPKQQPPELINALHSDPLGASAFGDWQTGNIITWFIRLFLLTDPTQPTPIGHLNDDVLQLSVAIVDSANRVMGGAFNETQAPPGVEPVFRADDPFLNAVMGGLDPILGLLGGQNAEAVASLCAHYPAFQAALENGKVGHHFMIARFDALATLDAFELVAGTADVYQAHGYEYLITEATNQWTGAAFEALGGTRVHFAPFRYQPMVEASAEPINEAVSSPDGFIADKDSGSMFYVLRFV